MDKVITNIYETYDYGKFKFIDGNRKIDHSVKIANSVQKNGQLFAPIVVNEKYEIIDGQNRFEAFKSLNLPIMYFIVEGYGLKECNVMNEASKNWTAKDYIHSYATSGNIDYQILETMLNKHPKLPLNIVSSVARNVMEYNDVQTIKSGTFSLKISPTSLSNILDYLDLFDISGIGGTSNNLYKIFVFCYKCKTIDKERMLKNFKERKYTIKGIVDTDDALAAIEEIYNYHYSKNSHVYLATEYKKAACESSAVIPGGTYYIGKRQMYNTTEKEEEKCQWKL